MARQELCVYDGDMESMFVFDCDNGTLLDLYRYVRDIEESWALCRSIYQSRADAIKFGDGDWWTGTCKGTWKPGANALFLHCINPEYAAREWQRLQEFADPEDLDLVHWPQHPGARGPEIGVETDDYERKSELGQDHVRGRVSRKHGPVHVRQRR